jgi:hypothetical protein
LTPPPWSRGRRSALLANSDEGDRREPLTAAGGDGALSPQVCLANFGLPQGEGQITARRGCGRRISRRASGSGCWCCRAV